MEKKKKINFSEEVDSRISGFALVFTLIVVGLVLQFNDSYFGNSIITKVIEWVCVVFGVLGFAVELGKAKNNITGLDDLLLGLFLCGGWFALFKFANHWLANTLSFFLLVIGLYSFFSGIQEVLYSVLYRDNANKKDKEKGDLLLFLTKLLGVVLVVVQICKAVMDLGV